LKGLHVVAGFFFALELNATKKPPFKGGFI
jgi:hypothetical protein